MLCINYKVNFLISVAVYFAIKGKHTKKNALRKIISKKYKHFVNKLSKGCKITNNERRNEVIKKLTETFSNFLVIKEMQIRLSRSKNYKSILS